MIIKIFAVQWEAFGEKIFQEYGICEPGGTFNWAVGSMQEKLLSRV